MCQALPRSHCLLESLVNLLYYHIKACVMPFLPVFLCRSNECVNTGVSPGKTNNIVGRSRTGKIRISKEKWTDIGSKKRLIEPISVLFCEVYQSHIRRPIRMKQDQYPVQTIPPVSDGIEAVFAHKSFCFLFIIVNFHFLLFFIMNDETHCNYLALRFQHNIW